MRVWTIKEVALRMGVSPQRVRVLARSGRMNARKVGGQWIIDELTRNSRKARPGRSLTSANAWALLALLCGESPDWIHPSVRSRLRRRLQNVDWLIETLLRSEARAVIVRWHCLSRDLPTLQREFRIVFSGISAVSEEFDVVPTPGEVDGYTDDKTARAIEKRFRPDHSSLDVNLVLRIPSHPWIFGLLRAPPPVVAADLLASDDSRTARAARDLLRRVAHGRSP